MIPTVAKSRRSNQATHQIRGVSLLVNTLVSIVKRTIFDKAWLLKWPFPRRRPSCGNDEEQKNQHGRSICKGAEGVYVEKHRAGDKEVRQGVPAQPRL